jgi:hypothetical protein
MRQGEYGGDQTAKEDRKAVPASVFDAKSEAVKNGVVLC